MILTKTVNVLITSSNYSHFEDLDYDVFIGERIDISVEHLQSGSQKKILCQCDICGDQKEIMFKSYLQYNNSWGDYTCRKCSEYKRKETMLKNWGCEHPLQDENIMNQMIKTMRKRWGVTHSSKSPILQDRKKKNKKPKD